MVNENNTISWEDAKKAKKQRTVILKTYNNDLCPCRSMKKYKNCCKKEHGKNRRFKYTFNVK